MVERYSFGMALETDDNVINISDLISENKDYQFQNELQEWLDEKVNSQGANVLSIIGALEVAKIALAYNTLEDEFDFEGEE